MTISNLDGPFSEAQGLFLREAKCLFSQRGKVPLFSERLPPQSNLGKVPLFSERQSASFLREAAIYRHSGGQAPQSLKQSIESHNLASFTCTLQIPHCHPNHITWLDFKQLGIIDKCIVDPNNPPPPPTISSCCV